MNNPEKIRIKQKSKSGDRWYDNYVGEVFKVTGGYNDTYDYYEVYALELYDKGIINYSHPRVQKEDAEIV
jgi:hypothetical protein